jgi:hypothetical protein
MLVSFCILAPDWRINWKRRSCVWTWNIRWRCVCWRDVWKNCPRVSTLYLNHILLCEFMFFSKSFYSFFLCEFVDCYHSIKIKNSSVSRGVVLYSAGVSSVGTSTGASSTTCASSLIKRRLRDSVKSIRRERKNQVLSFPDIPKSRKSQETSDDYQHGWRHRHAYKCQNSRNESKQDNNCDNYNKDFNPKRRKHGMGVKKYHYRQIEKKSS